MRNTLLLVLAMVVICIALAALKYFYFMHGRSLLGFGQTCLLPLALIAFFSGSTLYLNYRRAKEYLLQLGEDFVSGREPGSDEVRIPFSALTTVKRQWDCLRVDSKAAFTYLSIPLELDHFKEVEARLRAVAAHK